VLASPFGEAILIDRMQERDVSFWLPLQKILAEGMISTGDVKKPNLLCM